jgi:hypothetical protein
MHEFRENNRRRRGISVAELLIASAIIAMITSAMGTMAYSVRSTQRAAKAVSIGAQHARATLERIQRTLASATANNNFPGFIVFSELEGSFTYPDTLVVWRPAISAASPSGLPRWEELVIFSPDPDDPQRLLEITLPGDTATVPPLSDVSGWQTRLSEAKAGTNSQVLLVTDRLRVEKAANTLRAALRFDARLRPSENDWDNYLASTKRWQDLPWVQDIYSDSNGLRQNWCRIELQLRPDDTLNTAEAALLFLGSQTVNFQVTKP